MKTILKKLGLLLVMTMLFLSVSGQKITVSGTVFSHFDYTPLIGVSVLEKGTNNRTITDIDGNYKLTIQRNKILHFSYLGYTSQEIKADTAQLDVYLNIEELHLSEIVITSSSEYSMDIAPYSDCHPTNSEE